MFDYYDEKWYISLLKWLGLIFLGIIILLIIGLLFAYIPREKYHYEYIDLDNNKGIAKECSYKFEEIHRGGQGSPVCKLEDGTIKQVKEYKYIYDGKVVPIKEIFKEDK